MNHSFGQLFIIATVLIISLFACKQEEYKLDNSGLRYKIINEGANKPKVQLGDIMVLKFRIVDDKQQVIEESAPFRIQLKTASHEGGSIEDGLALLAAGDSAVFLINSEQYFTKTKKVELPQGVDPASFFEFQVKLYEIIPETEFVQNQQTAKLSREREEEILLKRFLNKSAITIDPLVSGLYIVEERKGNGVKPSAGQTVVVHYVGSFIDGRIFDSSYDRDKAFEFKLGLGEVIYGWEEGISHMEIGGKVKLIIPSYLAYGDKQMGPIPPYSTLVFDVELLAVK